MFGDASFGKKDMLEAGSGRGTSLGILLSLQRLDRLPSDTEPADGRGVYLGICSPRMCGNRLSARVCALPLLDALERPARFGKVIRALVSLITGIASHLLHMSPGATWTQPRYAYHSRSLPVPFCSLPSAGGGS